MVGRLSENNQLQKHVQGFMTWRLASNRPNLMCKDGPRSSGDAQPSGKTSEKSKTKTTKPIKDAAKKSYQA